MKNKFIGIVIAICTILQLSAFGVSAQNDVVYYDDFNYNYLDEYWRTETATSCYVTVDNNEMHLVDDNGNTTSPYYEGYAKAYRVFTPQYDKITVKFFFNSNKIPVGHEVITLNMGNTVAFEMMLNNHGENSHVRLKEGDKYHMVPSLYANRWHSAKIVVDLNNDTCEFYLDDLDECEIKTGLANDVDYIDRIVFSTGKELGEVSTLKIDNLTVLGTKLKAESIASDSALNLNVGGEGYITATVLPYEATEKDIAYSSSNTDVAVVDQKGLVKAKNAGTSIITLTNADGVKAVCKVNVFQSNGDITLNASYENKKVVISGVSPYGAKPATVTVKDNADKTIYFGYANCDNNGAFKLEIPYASDTDNKLKVDFKSGDAEKTAYLEYKAPLKQSSIKLDKELYVITFDGWQQVYRTIETEESEEPNVQVTTANKSVRYTAEPGGAIKFGLQSVDGPNDIRILGNGEGDFTLKVSTIEDVSATATALVQVNAREAIVTEESTDEYRKIGVAMKGVDIAQKINKGDMIRFAGGYAAYTPKRDTIDAIDSSFEVIKHNNTVITGIENVVAKYEFVCNENIGNSTGKLELPMDYLKEKIKDYACLVVLVSEDGKEWKNSGGYYDSATSSTSMVIENIAVPKYAAVAKVKIPFTDISGHFAEEMIKKYYIRGILDGNAKFRPNDYITLDELVALTNKTYATGEYGEKSNKPVTREKATKVICDLMKYNATNSEKVIERIKGFVDFADIDAQYLTSMGMLYNSKIIQGDDTKSLRPKGYITRAEAVVIMQRLQ